MKHELNFLDAIRMAKEAERKAAIFYADAAQKTSNPLSKELYEQLAGFERYHHTKLVDLEESLCENDACIMYKGRELVFPVPDKVEKIQESDKMSAMGIITMAIEISSKAQERYTTLAGRTPDPAGQVMFKRLAKEEHANHRILNNVYWELNNRGGDVWVERIVN